MLPIQTREQSDLARWRQQRVAGDPTLSSCPIPTSAVYSTQFGSSPPAAVSASTKSPRKLVKAAWGKCFARGHEAETPGRDQDAAGVLRRGSRSARAFQREAQVLASLNHPHIAGIHGLEESERLRARHGTGRGRGPVAALSRVARSRSMKRSRSRSRSPKRSKRHTSRASSIAISSPRTSRCARTAR